MTRYGWELSKETADGLGKLDPEAEGVKEVYWTRYLKADTAKGQGVFPGSDLGQVRCCGRLFIQESASKVKLCH